jgi:GT2 family glycosyltransferase
MKISVVIPTLAADDALEACLDSLLRQSLSPDAFETIVVDNSGEGRAARFATRCRVIACKANTGYGGGINAGIRESSAAWILALNDDTVLAVDCLQQLLTAAEQRREIGMCAPLILRTGGETIDSAGGLMIAPDGTAKQRGQGRSPSAYDNAAETLLPSGCAALYRREMLDEIGFFEESYFLYCEDTDLGLRARLAAWECVYVPQAAVEHRYSHSSGGGTSALKAYYVERNRLRTIVRNFPLPDLLLSPFHSAVRYWWHLQVKDGAAAQYKGDESLAMIAIRAWKDALIELPQLWKQRREIQSKARLTPKQFHRLLSTYRLTSKQVAAL